MAAAGTEGCLLLILFLDGDLPLPAFQVEGGEPAGPVQSVEEFVDARDGVSVFHGGRVELPEVDTELQAAVLLFHHNGW